MILALNPGLSALTQVVTVVTHSTTVHSNMLATVLSETSVDNNLSVHHTADDYFSRVSLVSGWSSQHEVQSFEAIQDNGCSHF